MSRFTSVPTSNSSAAQSYRERTDRDAVIAALVAVLFAHLLVMWLTPRKAYLPTPVEMPQREKVALELVPAPLEVEDEPEYVRANPTANNEVPLETTNISTQDQVAAQEKETLLDPENLPASDGELEDSNRIIQGDPYQQPPMPTGQASQQQPQAQPQQAIPPQQPAPAEPPAETRPELLAMEPETEEGMAVEPDPQDNLEPPEELEEVAELNPVERPSELDGPGQAQEVTPPQPAQQTGPQVPDPRPNRPTLADNSFGPRLKRVTGVSRTGRVAFNARYSEFGVYWNRVLEAIELRWNTLVANSRRSITFNNTSVTIQFVLTREGDIRDLRIIRSEVGRLPETLAVDAIKSPAPFDEWTPDMIRRMGTETVEQITFIY